MSLLDSIKSFSKCQLKSVETVIKTIDGRELVERRDAATSEFVVHTRASNGLGFVGDVKPDLQIAHILPFLLLGSQDVAHELSLLKEAHVTHILNLATGVPNSFEDHFTYMQLQLLDLPDTNIRSVFDDCFRFINGAKDADGRVFVHCNAGVSRSATVAVAYLIRFRAMHLTEAFEWVRRERPVVRPNCGFMAQLEQYDADVHARTVDRRPNL